MPRKKQWPGFEGNRAAGGRCGTKDICQWCGLTYTVRVPWQKFCRYRCRYENFLSLKIASWVRKAIIDENFMKQLKRNEEEA
jgi:hypothetical protein